MKSDDQKVVEPGLVFDDDLTMHGLTVIHQYNKDNA